MLNKPSDQYFGKGRQNQSIFAIYAGNYNSCHRLRNGRLRKKASQLFKKSKIKISFHATGIGILASGVKLTQLASTHQPDLIIQMGIAGCYIKTEPLGKIWAVGSESIADLGVREKGVFKDLFESQLLKDNEAPFKKRKITNPNIKTLNVL